MDKETKLYICRLAVPGLDSCLEITADDKQLREINWRKSAGELRSPHTPLLQNCCRQLQEYFRGERRHFQLPLKAPEGSAFQQQVWQAIAAIPYGHSSSYSELARKIGRPRAARAVGGGCHCNPLSIVIPCHRVLSAGRQLQGYGGGLPAKKRLLQLEGIDYRS